MSTRAQLRVWVGSTRGASQIRYNTLGRYVSTPVNTIRNYLPREAIQPTTTPEAFWQSVIDVVLADIIAGS